MKRGATDSPDWPPVEGSKNGAETEEVRERECN